MRPPLPDADLIPAHATLRVSAAWGLPALLEELGVPLADVLRDAGLRIDLFSSRENAMTYHQLQALFLASERRSQCDHFGLLVGQRSRLADMGLAGEIALCAATAGEGVRAFLRHFNLHDTAATCALVKHGRSARFVYAVLEQGMSDTRHFQFGGITIAFNILQDLCGQDFTPQEVTFASRAPANVRVFQQFFRAPVHFDKEQSSLAFSQSWLDRPLPSVDPVRRATIEATVSERYRQMLADFPNVVRRTVRKQLLAGAFTMDDVATVLCVHRRTLYRHLNEHGMRYSELLEGVREEVARQLLRETAMSIQQVADAVRFSSAANFATAFRRRTGMTPSAYRRQL